MGRLFFLPRDKMVNVSKISALGNFWKKKKISKVVIFSLLKFIYTQHKEPEKKRQFFSVQDAITLFIRNRNSLVFFVAFKFIRKSATPANEGITILRRRGNRTEISDFQVRNLFFFSILKEPLRTLALSWFEEDKEQSFNIFP